MNGRGMRFLIFLLASAIWASGCVGTGDLTGAHVWEERGSAGIDEDQYLRFGYSAEAPTTLHFEVSVSSGPNADFLVMDALNSQQFSGGHASMYVVDCSQLPFNNASGSCRLDAGEWHLIIDNTDYGEAIPPINGVNDPAYVTYHFWAD